jgi:hypothetical protein
VNTDSERDRRIRVQVSPARLTRHASAFLLDTVTSRVRDQQEAMADVAERKMVRLLDQSTAELAVCAWP